MTEKKARLAVTGLGKMGIMHTSMVNACPQAELVALVDRDQSLARHVASMGTDVPCYGSFADLAAAQEIDGVVIATPQFTHRALIEEALGLGWGVLVEKPLAHNVEDAQAALDAAKAHANLTSHVGFMKGHDPLFLLAAKLIGAGPILGSDSPSITSLAGLAYWADSADSGILGELKGFEASVHLGQVFSAPKGWTFEEKTAGGGVLINTGIHLLFLCHLFFGQLRGVAGRKISTHGTTEDLYYGVAEYEASGQGIAGSVSVSWSTPGFETEGTRVLVHGADGSIWIEDDSLLINLHEKAGPFDKGWTRILRSEIEAGRDIFNLSPDYAGEGYYGEVAAFASSILSGDPTRGYTSETGMTLQQHIAAYYDAAQHSDGWST